MSESVDLMSLNQHGATHNERASVYISDYMDADERELAAEMASYFQQKDKMIENILMVKIWGFEREMYTLSE